MDTLERCLKFWYKIHNIQVKDIYSHAEVSHLMKEIEAELPELAELNGLPKYLDLYYKEDPQTKIEMVITINRLRDPFHLYLKRMNADPAKELE